MNKSIHIAGGFVGLVVGAGFASGQEILQYFTSFGWLGAVGALIATVVFSLLGMQIAQLGSELQATSHKEVIYKMAGPYLGIVMDVFISCLLFGVAVVMFAGSGAMFEQMFGIRPVVGSSVMVVLTIFTLMLNSKSILHIIAAVTPYFLLLVFGIAVYSILKMDLTLMEQHTLAIKQRAAASNWWLSAILYVSYNIATGTSILAVMGGAVNKKAARWGGFFGGILLGLLILIIHIAMLTKIDIAAGKALPMLALANDMHPLVAVLMIIALFAMMYNTAVGMMYSLTVRVVSPDKNIFKTLVVFLGLVGFIVSFIGFTTLVSKLYSVMGYAGFLLIFVIVLSLFKK